MYTEDIGRSCSKPTQKNAICWSERYGRKCKINPMKRHGAIVTLWEHCKHERATTLQSSINIYKKCSWNKSESFQKRELSKFLLKLADQPGCDGYMGLKASATASQCLQSAGKTVCPLDRLPDLNPPNRQGVIVENRYTYLIALTGSSWAFGRCLSNLLLSKHGLQSNKFSVISTFKYVDGVDFYYLLLLLPPYPV